MDTGKVSIGVFFQNCSQGTSNPDIVTTRLSNTDFLRISDNYVTYYGGNQDWFQRYTEILGGCGPTAAANILAYMAMTNPELRKLYDFDTQNITKEDFGRFMEDVYKYVTLLRYLSLIIRLIEKVNR